MTQDDDNRAEVLLRTQTAVVRTLTDELRRPGRGTAANLEGQVLEESARLASTMNDLARSRSSRPSPADSRGVTARPVAESIAKRRWRILVVEDEESPRLVLVRFLEQDYEVVAAYDGIEGLDCALRATPDVIVTDIGMPKLDGISMVGRMKTFAVLRDTPVLFLTAAMAPESIAAGISAGAHSYLAKPVDLDLLGQQVRRALTSRAL